MKQVISNDSGSTLLGFLIAFLALDFWRSRPDAHSALVFPFVLAGFPLLDAALAILRRLRLGVSPVHGDRFHLYDLLLARAWSHRRVAIACYAINLAFVASASFIVFIPSPKSLWPAALVSVVFLLLAISLGSLGPSHTRPSRPV